MNVRECLNRALAHLPMVDSQDLSILAGVISDLEIIASNGSLPESLRKQASRICKLGESIILNESVFEIGMKKFNQSLTMLEKTLYELEQTSQILQGNNELSNDSVLSSNDLNELRVKFASQQKPLLDDFEAYILDFEKNVPSAPGAIKRMLHTWKGEFGVLDFPKMSCLVHNIEDAIENGTINADGLLKLKDHLADSFHKMASGLPVIPASTRLFFNTDTTCSVDYKSSEPGTKTGYQQVQPSQTGQLPENDLSLVHDFIQESRDHIHSAETLMLDLESDPTNAEFINSIFRSFHTIKGVSGFLGIREVTELAHSIENVIDQARKNVLIIKPAHIDLFLHSMDCLKEIISNIEAGCETNSFTIPASYSSIMEKLSVPDAIELQYDITTSGPPKKLGTLLYEKGEIDNVQLTEALRKQDSGDLRKIGKILIEDNGVPVRSVAKAIAVQTQSRITRNVEETIRVPVNRLDQLIDAIGEAMISQSMVTADPAVKFSDSQTLLTKISQTNLIMRQIQELSMSLRMVSVKATFQKMARLVRDLSKKHTKEIEFITEGEDTEIDKSVVENIGDPLIHMIRNSVDHGIEMATDREAAHKSRIAKIHLRAYHKAGNVFIEIQDDGRGLDKDAIFEKAVSKGLCKPDDKLTENEIYQFIFLPGFSTAKVITDVSGRGVGMDVVKRNIETLRGSVEMSSEKGNGTTFTIRLPLTLAIIDGMVVKVDAETCIIPTLSIIETISTSYEHIETVLDKGNMIKVRGNLIPLLHLSGLFNNNHSKLNDKAKVTLIIEDMLGRKAGLLVDEIIGQQQVVIKNLGNGLGEVPGISGGAIMSDGSVSLIIDVSNIVRTAFGN